MHSNKFEYLECYAWKDFDTDEKRGNWEYFTRVGDSTEGNDFIVFFKNLRDMQDFDDCYQLWNNDEQSKQRGLELQRRTKGFENIRPVS